MTSAVPISPIRGWAAVWLLAVGVFVMCLVEQLPVGLLPYIRRNFSVSSGAVGLMVTGPSLVAGCCAPLLAVWVGRLDRRLVLAALMALLAVASAAAATTGSYALMLMLRLLVGVSIGGFWAIAAGLTPRLVNEKAVARANAVFFGGVSTALVLGIPAATFLGDRLGWRSAFLVAAGISALLAALLIIALPRLTVEEGISLSDLVETIGGRTLRRVLTATALIVVGHFAAYTYVSPIAQSLFGVPLASISALLLGYGIAGVFGNVVWGFGAARDPRFTEFCIATALALLMLAIALFVRSETVGIAVVLLWGFAYGGVSVTQQTWTLRVSPTSAEAASSLAAFVFNISIAFGALFGGLIVDHVSLVAVHAFSAALFIMAVLVIAAASASRAIAKSSQG